MASDALTPQHQKPTQWRLPCPRLRLYENATETLKRVLTVIQSEDPTGLLAAAPTTGSGSRPEYDFGASQVDAVAQTESVQGAIRCSEQSARD